jgi:precorrin-6B methylase 2
MTDKDWHPGELLAMSGYYWKTFTLHAAVKLDVFTRIGREGMSAGTLARSLAGDLDGMERLLNALAAMGLLRKKGEAFFNTPAGLRYLHIDSPDYIGWMILHHHHLVDPWRRLDEAVLSGSPTGAPARGVSDKWREAFLKGMHTNARLQAPSVVKAVDFTQKRRLLDLGGGPGTYAIEFCRSNPGLTAVVFDLPQSKPVAEENIRRAGLEERIVFQGGDFHEDPVEGEFDAAWLSHILHGEGPEDCRRIIRMAASALTSGGTLLIHEFILDNTRTAPEFPALFSLNMRVNTPSGRAYAEEELTRMMGEAGASGIERLDFRGPTDSGILSGRVP